MLAVSEAVVVVLSSEKFAYLIERAAYFSG